MSVGAPGGGPRSLAEEGSVHLLRRELCKIRRRLRAGVVDLPAYLRSFFFCHWLKARCQRRTFPPSLFLRASGCSAGSGPCSPRAATPASCRRSPPASGIRQTLSCRPSATGLAGRAAAETACHLTSTTRSRGCRSTPCPPPLPTAAVRCRSGRPPGSASRRRAPSAGWPRSVAPATPLRPRHLEQAERAELVPLDIDH